MTKSAASAVPLVRIGIAGFGTAGRSFVPAIQSHPGFELVAFAEPAPQIRSEIKAELGAAAYSSLTDMLAHPGLDAVYIATPTVMHEEHVTQALQAGKHVLVEKPMAINVAHARSMVDAAKATGRVFVVGHSHGYDLPIQEMRRLISGGTLGRVRMVNTSCYTDWMQRPRRNDELDISLGGGVTYRQGSHQFDIIRTLCGGLVRSVRARTFDWSQAKPGQGAHMVFLDFEGGAAACAVYNGYGAFSSVDLCFNITESGFERPSQYGPRPVAAGNASPEDVIRAKQERAKRVNFAKAPFQPAFGLTLVSCERGEIRQSPNGLLVYTDEGMSEVALSADWSPRDLVLREMHDAIAGKMPALHDAAWGLANLEVCDAAIESSATGRDVMLQHQVALPEGW